MLRTFITASFAIISLSSSLASASEFDGPGLLTKDGEVVGIITLKKAFTAPMAACNQISGTIKVEGLQFSDSGKTLKSFYFEDSNGNNWSVPTGFEELNFTNKDNGKINNFIKKGRSYFVRLQACGSGGYVDLLDIYNPKALNNL